MCSCSHFKSFLSLIRERTVIGDMSKRGQNTTSNDGSPTAKARPINLVMHSLCSEEISSRSWGCLVYPGNDDERKGVGQAPGNWMLPDLELGVGYSQVRRQEKVLQATQKQGRRIKQFRHMEFPNHQHKTKIFQFLQKKLGTSANSATFAMQSYKTNVLIW